jgi:hypothetical protein
MSLASDASETDGGLAWPHDNPNRNSSAHSRHRLFRGWGGSLDLRGLSVVAVVRCPLVCASHRPDHLGRTRTPRGT